MNLLNLLTHGVSWCIKLVFKNVSHTSSEIGLNYLSFQMKLSNISLNTHTHTHTHKGQTIHKNYCYEMKNLSLEKLS